MEVQDFITKTGYSYKEVAFICEVHPVTVARWMNGDRNPSAIIKKLLLLWYQANVANA